MKHLIIKLTTMSLLLTAVSVPVALIGSGKSLAGPAPLQQAENVAAVTNSCNNTTTNGNVDQTKVQNCVASTPVWNDIQTIVDFLSAGVGVIVTGVILVGGIQYIVAGDNPNALTAARQRIMNGLIALFIFLFIFAFLQWLIPGGIFK